MKQATSTGTSVTISDIKPGLYSVSATSGETKSVYSPVALFVRVDGTVRQRRHPAYRQHRHGQSV